MYIYTPGLLSLTLLATVQTRCVYAQSSVINRHKLYYVGYTDGIKNKRGKGR